jgi:hypothetical protein
MVVCGGGADVVCFDPDGEAWDRPELEGVGPASRRGHSMTALDNEKAVVCGGEATEGGGALGDVWLLVCDKGAPTA